MRKIKYQKNIQIKKISSLLENSKKYSDTPTQENLDQAKQALDLCLQTNDQRMTAECFVNLGNIFRHLSDYQQALEMYTNSLKIREALSDKDKIADCLSLIGITLCNLNKYDSALENYQRALKVREELNDNKSAAYLLNSIGIVYWNLSSYEKALSYYQKSLKLREKIKDKKGIASTLNNIGLIYRNLGFYDKTSEYYFKSLKIREEIGVKKDISGSLNNIGILYLNLKKYNQALQFYLNSLKISEEINDKIGVAGTNNNIGLVYWNKGDHDKALAHHFKALELYEELNEKSGIAKTLNNIGNDYNRSNQNTKALEFYMKALKIKETIGDKRGIASTLSNGARLYLNLGKLKQAREFLKRGLEIAKKIKAKDLLREIYQVFSELYEIKKDDKNAFKYFKLYSKIKDEIFTEESNKQIALLQTIYETEKKEKEAEIYKLKNVELAEANREIQQKNKELNIHREHLEEIVRERTKELISSNKQLKREIHEHKLLDKALQKSNERLKKLLEETVNGLVSALEIRDPYTAGHQKRVAILANAIAKSMKLSQEQIDGIRISATLHDIGKMEVPGEILSKPGKLSDIQFSLIKNHPQAGYEILKSIEFPWPVAKIVYQHHEKLNGSGYPQGLSGDEIILEAKILCVADVVEAMASHRPYRPARGIDATLEEIQKNKRILYDPEVVDVCYRLFKNKGFNFHE